MAFDSVRIRGDECVVSPRLKTCFSVFMALYPVLCIYKAFSSFTIGDVILILFCGLSFLYPIKLQNKYSIVVLFCSYAFGMLCFNQMLTPFGSADNDMAALMLRCIKFIFYMICVFTCARRFFDTEVFRKTLYRVSIAACFFIIFQYIMFYGAGKIVMGTIPGLPLHLDEYAELDYERIYSFNFRPCSFFLEPSLFSHYIIVALACVLFDEKVKEQKRWIFAALFTAGIAMSTAGQGMLYMVITYLIYAFRGTKSHFASMRFILFAVIVFLICYNEFEPVQRAVNRLLFNEKAADARLGTYKVVFQIKNIKALLFGHGYGSTYGWMAGVTYIWYGCGLVGLFMVFGMFITFYKNAASRAAKTLSVLFFIMFFGTGLFYNYMVYWYFALISNIKRLEGDKTDENSLHIRSIQAKSVG